MIGHRIVDLLWGGPPIGCNGLLQKRFQISDAVTGSPR
jgi:hypothetical protein